VTREWLVKNDRRHPNNKPPRSLAAGIEEGTRFMTICTKGRLARVCMAAALACASFGAAAQSGQHDLVGWLPAGTVQPSTGNNTAPSNWRVTQGLTFNGVNFDGNVRINFDSDGSLTNGGFVCSGTLIAGGTAVLTAAHCADDYAASGFVMTVSHGLYNNVAAGVQNISGSQVSVHPGWTGALSTGADIAVIRLNTRLTGVTSFNLSTTNDVGKQFLIMGHGTTSVGNVNTATNWNEYGWAHFGYNTIDSTGTNFFNAAQAQGIPNLGTWNSQYGEEYVADFDGISNGTGTSTDPGVRHNTMGRITGITSGQGVGANEALIAGGDSGGGDFVWDGSQWLLTGVHSWGWQFCGGRLTTPNSCDFGTANSSSWGDLMGSTAVFSHVTWINTVAAIPEPGTYGLMALGLAVVGVAARRRKAG
jgi:Trypsin/PEP-CTERM motif